MPPRRHFWLLLPVAIAACNVFPETSPEAVVHYGLEAGTDASADATGGTAGTAGTGAKAGTSGSSGSGGLGGSSGVGGGGAAGDSGPKDASDSGEADVPDAIDEGDAEPADGADAAGEADANDTGGPESGTTVTITAKLGGGSDDVNEDGAVFTDNATTVWLGNATQKHNSYTGLRFGPVAIPNNATIVFAHLRVNAAADSSATITFNYGAEAADDCAEFQASSPPSSRTLTNATVSHGTDNAWLKNGVYTLDEITPVVQEVVSRGGWASGSHLCVITKGVGAPNLTRAFFSVEGSAPQAAVLIIRYTAP
jgi:hypothetical protein